mmetsp:Transcript_2039/g.5370  ORF Transcript_2039/g.5370 Transcript_2039/m.5370 type:complete len:168 (-) Transcript_2039:356-859(-)
MVSSDDTGFDEAYRNMDLETSEDHTHTYYFADYSTPEHKRRPKRVVRYQWGRVQAKTRQSQGETAVETMRTSGVGWTTTTAVAMTWVHGAPCGAAAVRHNLFDPHRINKTGNRTSIASPRKHVSLKRLRRGRAGAVTQHPTPRQSLAGKERRARTACNACMHMLGPT